MQAAARGKKTAAVTEADPNDPLASKYGDVPMVQSAEITDRKWTDVAALKPELDGTEVSTDCGRMVCFVPGEPRSHAQPSVLQVLLRARVFAVRGKGKSAFLVLRQQLATVQAVLFVDDEIVSKGMVKYASAIPRESIVDVTGVLTKPVAPVEGCSQAEVWDCVLAVYEPELIPMH